MLVKELRDVIKKYDEKDLNDIIVELYKRIPKSVKEEYEIDNYLINLKDAKKIKKEEESISFESLTEKVTYFLECVDNNLYAHPNKIINKNERSKWRFKVKRFYKELNKYPANTKEGLEATILLIQLFKRLSYGCMYLKFSNWNTFGAIGIEQSVYYDNIIKRLFANSVNETNLNLCISLLDVNKDQNELSTFMYDELIDNLNSKESKEQAIPLLDNKISELKEELKEARDYSDKFYIEENINDTVYAITNIYFTLDEFEKGIAYFQKNYQETTSEVKEFILLNEIEKYHRYEEWIKEYESHTILYRESLVEKYRKFKNIKEVEIKS